MLRRIGRFLRANPGAPFIIAFEIVVILLAGALLAGHIDYPNQVALYAFYTIAVGVLVQLVALIKGRIRHTEANR